MLTKIEVPIGTKFGHWTTTSEKYRVEGKIHYVVDVVCKCGRTATLYAAQLNAGKTTGCRYCIRATRSSRPPREHVIATVYGWYLKSAKGRSIAFDLPIEKFAALLFMNCYYCGTEPKNKMSDRMDTRGVLPRYGGVDRVDNSVGYCESNVVPCCRWCNEAKRAKTHDEFLDWIRGLAANSLGGENAQGS